MRLFKFVLLFLATASAGLAHEFWIDAEKYQVKDGETVVADFRNGQKFVGGALAWFDHRAVRAEANLGDTRDPLTGRAGDLPAITYQPTQTGLLQIIVQTGVDTISYAEPEKFADFVAQKDLDISADPSPDYPLKEAYTRYVKALIGVGAAAGQDKAAGLEIEFVALKNPYTDDLSAGLPVQLVYQDAPRADAQVEIFEKDAAGEVLITLTRTDANGIAQIAVKPGHSYLLDAVLLRKPAADLAAEKDVDWQSLWAALTFAVPN